MSDAAATTEPSLKISELAEAAGVPVATVRHYLREGLLPEGRKTSRNMAYYPPELVERIRLIKLLQEERFMPLKVISRAARARGRRPRAGPVAARGRRPRLRRGARPRARAGPRRRGQRAPRGAASRRSTGSPSSASSARAADGYSPSDVRIVEAIARFRAGGYDERIGFTVYDAARFLEPLRALARREVELLSEKLVGRIEPDRAAELIEAGIDPLADLIAAMNSKLRRGRARGPGAAGGLPQRGCARRLADRPRRRPRRRARGARRGALRRRPRSAWTRSTRGSSSTRSACSPRSGRCRSSCTSASPPAPRIASAAGSWRWRPGAGSPSLGGARVPPPRPRRRASARDTAGALAVVGLVACGLVVAGVAGDDAGG